MEEIVRESDVRIRSISGSKDVLFILSREVGRKFPKFLLFPGNPRAQPERWSLPCQSRFLTHSGRSNRIASA
jgi:hypothetical protein